MEEKSEAKSPREDKPGRTLCRLLLPRQGLLGEQPVQSRGRSPPALLPSASQYAAKALADAPPRALHQAPDTSTGPFHQTSHPHHTLTHLVQHPDCRNSTDIGKLLRVGMSLRFIRFPGRKVDTEML